MSTKEKPILFSAPMVRAILDGRKTQTRRVVKCETTINAAEHSGCMPILAKRGERLEDGSIGRKAVGFSCSINDGPSLDDCVKMFCPYGQVGDRLWVRETWATYYRETTKPDFREADDVVFRADYEGLHPDVYGCWRPSIHMPRWACRIELEITGVRVERLQDISPDDAIAEGLTAISKDGGRTTKYGIPDSDGYPGTDNTGWPWEHWRFSPVDAFQHLWESINGAGSWDANPWVWVIEFKRVKP